MINKLLLFRPTQKLFQKSEKKIVRFAANQLQSSKWEKVPSELLIDHLLNHLNWGEFSVGASA